jgi:hypothetical protein
MTPKQVQRRRDTLQRRIQKSNQDLTMLRNECGHPNVTKKYGSNTGNYDPSSDSYWIDWHCPDCGKFWTTDQDRENTLKPGIEVK